MNEPVVFAIKCLVNRTAATHTTTALPRAGVSGEKHRKTDGKLRDCFVCTRGKSPEEFVPVFVLSPLAPISMAFAIKRDVIALPCSAFHVRVSE